jgi:type II secretory pathway component PulC
MKSLLWILNSTFAAILGGVALILWIYRPKAIPRKSLQPVAIVRPSETRTIAPVDLARIYERDPFGTTSNVRRPEAEPIPSIVAPVAPVPQTPQIRRNAAPAPAAPTFLPPMGISLKGVMHSMHEHDNRAIIADKKSKQERMYKVGDSVLDAEIIRIEPNQVMFMRSNGQQEVLFITPSEALSDPIYTRLENARNLPAPVKKIDGSHYIIDPILLQSHITNMAQIIDALDITTVIENNLSIGCRIGSMQAYSIGILLGLQAGDLIITINDIPTATTAQRLTIYQQLLTLRLEDTIQVELRRGENRLKITYTLQSLSPLTKTKSSPVSTENTNKVAPAAPINSSKSINPAEKLHKDNKNAMLKQGGKPTTLRSIKP